MKARIILLNKPFGVISQFQNSSIPTLSEYIKLPGFYAAGRLDKDSEGLLILTNNGKAQHIIAHPDNKLAKTYWAQVEGQINEEAIIKLRNGVHLKDGLTRPANAKLIEKPTNLWSRTPPIRKRINKPTSWLELTIKEGKNRQVRRMSAATGFPTLRLIRVQIGKWSIGALNPGQSTVLDVELHNQ